MEQFVSSYRWAIVVGAVLLPLGFILHPPLTVEGMGEPIWAPDHVLILLSLVLLIPGYPMLTLQAFRPSRLGWAGLALLYLSLCSFLGVVYFELMIIPTLVEAAPHVLNRGLLIGSLAWFLPLTGVSYVVAHFILGAAWLEQGEDRLWVALMMVGSIGVGLKPILLTALYITGAIAQGCGIIALSRRLAASPQRSKTLVGRGTTVTGTPLSS